MPSACIRLEPILWMWASVRDTITSQWQLRNGFVIITMNYITMYNTEMNHNKALDSCLLSKR